MENPICAECGEYFPCTVAAGRESYRAEIAAAHRPAATAAPIFYSRETNHAAAICPGFWEKTATSNLYRESTECPHCKRQVECTVAPNGSARIALHNL